MSNEKKRAFNGKFKERAVALAKERKNVAQTARELEISGSRLSDPKKIQANSLFI